MNNRMGNSMGFTLVELMVVVAIIRIYVQPVTIKSGPFPADNFLVTTKNQRYRQIM